MSSDLIQDLIQDNIPDKNGVDILLTLYVGGLAHLTIMLPDRDENYNPIEVTPAEAITYVLTPDDTGMKNAETIMNALNHWIQHIKGLST